MLLLLRSRLRTFAVPVIMTLVAVLAAGVISGLQGRADAARLAQNRVTEISHAVLQHSSISRAVGTGAPVAMLTQASTRFRRQVEDLAAKLAADAPPATIPTALDKIDAIMANGDRLFAAAIKRGVSADPRSPGSIQLTGQYVALDPDLTAAKASYAERARAARVQATVGTVITVMVLLAAFAIFYFRSIREHKTSRQLFLENAELLRASRRDSLTDALTGLRNRRALATDLADLLVAVDTRGVSVVVALFDLDGFKRYNDTFGHAAGDELLMRLGRRLRAEADASGAKAYRLGGDEFCVLYDHEPEHLEARIDAARAALADEGTGWMIGASVGVVCVPAEAADVESALVLADERMYRDKGKRTGRPSTLRSMTAQLRHRTMETATGPVASMAASIAAHLDLPAEDREALRVAADLHDIGKSAIPDSILAKQGHLDDEEWAFVRNHTLTGGRLAFAAHAQAHTASLVRSSHEHFDGTGYPDGLTGAAIPLGARIIAVCDAFSAMTSERPFRTAMSSEQALKELRACAGSQFDPAVVDAFEASGAPAWAAASATTGNTPPARLTVDRNPSS